jgi:hypothetical protein
MTVTHGTRSAYNRGCRCEACREASRLARARQRAAASDGTARTELGVTTAPPWVFAVVLAAAGAGLLWYAKNLRTAVDQSEVPVWPWVVSGVVLLAIASGITASAIRPLHQRL